MNTESETDVGRRGIQLASANGNRQVRFLGNDERAIEAAGAQLEPWALRRFNPGQPSDDLLSPLRKLRSRWCQTVRSQECPRSRAGRYAEPRTVRQPFHKG